MERFLGQILQPSDLSKLYDTLLSRCTSDHPEYLEYAVTALKLLAISRRPLSITELGWAVALGAAEGDLDTVDDVAMLVDHERVIELIRPFISGINFEDLKRAQITLVHQSVKDYIIRKIVEGQRSDGRAMQTVAGHTTSSAAMESLEAFMLEVCVKYLLLDDINRITFFSPEQTAIDEMPQTDIFDSCQDTIEYDPHCTWEEWERDMIRYDPTERGFGEFFVYAACHWIDHFGAVTQPIWDMASIERLCQVGSVRLSNWIEQHRRPDCTFMARFKFDSRLYDPLSITALYGSEAALRQVLTQSEFDMRYFLPGTALEAADQIIQWGDPARLKILVLEGKLTQQLRNLEFWELVIYRWNDPAVRRLDWNVVFDLIPDTLDALAEEHGANELLYIAARAGCTPIIQHLMISVQHSQTLRAELLQMLRCEAMLAT